ncbi:MAG: peptidase, partial [Thermoanaerobaculia bacterium]
MRLFSGILMVAILGGCAPAVEKEAATSTGSLEVAPDVAERLAQFEPTDLVADVSSLSEGELRVLEMLVQAARSMDEIFLRQVWQGNPELAAKLQGVAGPEMDAAREYFTVNFGPWDRLEEMAPFIGTKAHPPGAGYYPEGMTQSEFENWLAEHPEDEGAFTSEFTVIRRQDGGL